MRVKAIDRRERIVSGVEYHDQTLKGRFGGRSRQKVVKNSSDRIKICAVVRRCVEQGEALFVIVGGYGLL
ncbi:MAG: hypothetical protein DCC44_12315 [Acidobacteria bacterium]|nr:MAG: hypothetical protein DCC44_12315 [Acidobacteriota bacterium]